MSSYAGRKGRVYASTTGTGTAVPVAQLSQWSLNMATDTYETTAFGATNKTYVQGLPDISGSFQGFWSDSDTTIMTAAGSADGCKLYLYPSTDASTKYACGPAWLNASLAVDVGGTVNITANFSSNGSWDTTRL